MLSQIDGNTHKLKIVDSVSGKPINKAIIIDENQFILFTNEFGFVSIQDDINQMNIQKTGYYKITLTPLKMSENIIRYWLPASCFRASSPDEAV